MRYRIKALRAGEGVSALLLDAGSPQDAARQAEARGYAVISLTAVRTGPAGWLEARRADFPLLPFSQELLALLESGLSLVEAIESLAEKEAQPDVRATLTRLLERLYEGRTLSQALEQTGAPLPPLYVATVRASEKTGALPEALARYIAYQTQIERIRRQVVSASIYPLLLAGVGGLVTLFLLVYVVPRFSQIYADMGGELPLMSRLLMAWGEFLNLHGPSLLLGALAAAGLLVFAATRPAFRLALLRRVWRVPAIGARMQVYQLARFYRAAGMLLRGGMPAVTALQMVAGLLPADLRARLEPALRQIREGQPMSLALERHGLTTPVALRMLRVGEKSGRMGEMMERAAAFYEDESARWVDRFVRLFEPLLMAVIGVVIGLIVVLMYFPIFELAGSLQ